MKKLLVFQHVAHEILGTFHPLLKKAGFRLRYVNFGRPPHAIPEVTRYDGLVILGGPMGVYETERYPHLADELTAIREMLAADKPILGICLGAQLVAAALGAKVAPSPNKEIGWFDVSPTEDGQKDPVLGALGGPRKIFQWHNDAFDRPPGAAWLASSGTCPNQAFRHGDRVYGFQFHLEVDEHMIERWLTVEGNQRDLRAVEAVMPVDRIRQETLRHIENLKQLSHDVFSRYIDLFSTKRRKLTLGSGHK